MNKKTVNHKQVNSKIKEKLQINKPAVSNLQNQLKRVRVLAVQIHSMAHHFFFYHPQRKTYDGIVYFLHALNERQCLNSEKIK